MLQSLDVIVPPTPSKPVIALCLPIADRPHAATFRSIQQLRIPRPFHRFDAIDKPVEIARNTITEAVLEHAPEATHLLWIDDDMVFEPDALDRLLAHDLPIVGGLCHNRRHPYMPILLYQGHPGDPGGMAYRYRYAYPQGLVEVEATGAAFLLVKREVFERIHESLRPGEGPWSQRGFGEDVSFCERAREAGYQIHVDTTLEIGHVGEVVITSTFARRNRDCELNPWVPSGEPPAGEPQATIVIPTYNQRPAWLAAAIESAKRQTVPVEILIIDNGSTECPWCGKPKGACSPKCVGPPTGPNLRVLTIPTNRRLWPALNLAIREMTTPWFAWLSSDDTIYPRKVERQLKIMRAVGVSASFHGYETVLGEDDDEPHLVGVPTWRTCEEAQRDLARGCCINGLTAMIRRDVLAGIGGFDESILISSDWDAWNRIAAVTRWHPIPEVLATRREYGNATEALQRDPIERQRWADEDAMIRAKYARSVDPL